jgi:hypothetical protein
MSEQMKLKHPIVQCFMNCGVILTLGNLTIITQALNASIRDSDWATKKNGKGDKGGLRKYAEGIETSPLILTQMLGMKMQFRIE